MPGFKHFGGSMGGAAGGGAGRRAALWLDFARGVYRRNRQRLPLSSIFTAISGGVNGTRVNSAGLIEAATCPRFDHDPVTLAPRGVLIEEQRTNLLTYSSAFDNAAWTATDATVSADTIASPSGSTDADRITSTAVFAAASVSRLLTIADDTAIYSLGLFAKAGTLTSARIRAALIFGTPVPSSTDVDLAAGTLNATGEAPLAQAIAEYASDWWRSWVAVQNNASGNTGMAVQFYPGALNLGVTGNEGYWGAEVQAGSFMTSHIPTGAAAVTRTADSLTMTGADFSSWWNQTEGTIVVKFRLNTIASGTTGCVFDMSSASNNTMICYRDGNKLMMVVVDANSVQFAREVATVAANTDYTFVFAYADGDFEMRLNEDPSITEVGTVPTGLSAGIGCRPYDLSTQLNGHIYSFGYTPARLNI